MTELIEQDDEDSCLDCGGSGKMDCPEECFNEISNDDKECEECGGDQVVDCEICDGTGEA